MNSVDFCSNLGRLYKQSTRSCETLHQNLFKWLSSTLKIALSGENIEVI